MKFTAGGAGKVRSLTVDAAKKADAIAAFVAIASAKPVQPQQRFRGTNANAADGKAPPAPAAIKKQ